MLNFGGVEIQSYWLTQNSGWFGWPHSWCGFRISISLEYNSSDAGEVFEMIFRQDCDGKEVKNAHMYFDTEHTQTHIISSTCMSIYKKIYLGIHRLFLEGLLLCWFTVNEIGEGKTWRNPMESCCAPVFWKIVSLSCQTKTKMEPPCRCRFKLRNLHLLTDKTWKKTHVLTNYLEVCFCIHARPWKWDRNRPSQARSVASWWWLQPPASMVSIVGLQSPAPWQLEDLEVFCY